MKEIVISDRPMLFAYWLPRVGIGPEGPSQQYVTVPITDVLNYRRRDGSYQIDVINLFGCTFNTAGRFDSQYLVLDDILTQILTDGSVKRLQDAGIKVVLTILGSGTNVRDPFGWGSISDAQIPGFVDYLDTQVLGTLPGQYGLDGIDIDNEYPTVSTNLPAVVKAMFGKFGDNKIISKALWDDDADVRAIRQYLTWGGIMYYGNSVPAFEKYFNHYVTLGMRADQLTIGVNAGPIAQGGSFTSVETAKAVTAWQPTDATKLGMMIWSFSQDIQQFTANPQNQPALKFPNRGDHEWQGAIIGVMDEGCVTL